ncbi:Glyoxalase 3 [Lasiodiplodia theobromae]|uniref:D-lactate dehydratase n=1 Tax=Lasiodiplodia theobromae TaxID=45133 RepID=A0A5N5D7V1_9PEZI|nr:Glyoxalase 3 [Lasiodiplodia theobromae]
MAPPRKALIAVTSAHAPLYPDGKETGLFITEALHPFNVFKEAGFEVDLISETGTYHPDWLSQQKEWLKDEDRKVWEDHNSEFRSKLDKLLKPSDVHWKDYGLFFASAGHASLIDYPTARGLQLLASHIYASNSGILSAVCHGGAIFPGVLDPTGGASGNAPIIAGKRVTGFTTKGEEEEGVLDTIKSWNRPTIESSAAAAGATYVSPPGPWDAFAVTDGRVVTGANPASAHKTAVEAVKAFDAIE